MGQGDEESEEGAENEESVDEEDKKANDLQNMESPSRSCGF